MPSSQFPIALTIAGSDSGGGAGIQADIKTFQAFGVFGTSAITAITAQNTTGVSAVHPIPLALVREQIERVAEDLPPAATKTGMLARADLVEVVADALAAHRLSPYVLDPVMVSTSGHPLLERDAVEAVVRRLIPLATLVTPNLEEARILTGLESEGETGARATARRLVEMGAAAALIKGGHGAGEEVLDLLWDGRTERIWRHARIHTRHTHGTGCTLSAGITAGLAQGALLEDSVDRALSFVAAAIREAPGLGSGHGPLNHFVSVPRAVPPIGEG